MNAVNLENVLADPSLIEMDKEKQASLQQVCLFELSIVNILTYSASRVRLFCCIVSCSKILYRPCENSKKCCYLTHDTFEARKYQQTNC